MTIACNDGNIRNAAVGKFETALATMIEQALRSTAFGKISSVYGHIAENGSLVRKISAVSDPVLRTNAPKRGFCP